MAGIKTVSFFSGACLAHTTISQQWKHAENVKMVSFERRDPNLKDNIEFVAVCG